MNNYFKHLENFAKATEITRSEMRDIVLTWYEPFKIYSRKVDGSRIVRDVYSFSGPSRADGSPMDRYEYDSPPYNYMILYDLDADGYRTFLMDDVYKLQKYGKTYLVN
jgi:hypothetical protein